MFYITKTIMLASTLLFSTKSSSAFVQPAQRVAFGHVMKKTFHRSAKTMMAGMQVYFDMEVGGEEVGRMTFELRDDGKKIVGLLNWRKADLFNNYLAFYSRTENC